MTVKIGDIILNRVPAHYYKNSKGQVKEITNTEIVVVYKLNDKTNIDIRHNIFDLKYFEIVQQAV